MTHQTQHSTPIAVVGIGCRFPGDISSEEKLWDFLVEKKSARDEVPSDRYNVDAFYHPDGEHYGTTNNRAGHFLAEDVSLFDAPFFAISPAEAMAMDPMQRILLEVAYEALENSGTSLSQVSGSQTSCYIGCFTKDYEEMQRRDMELAPKYQSTGASQTMLSNRLSHFFNLKGPSITLDTACSSGLVAVHLACQSLRSGESTMAVVGGSNLILSPDIQIEMSDMHFLSPDSVSYAFDERANGYARGEGVGVVILKSLDLALRDNDPIQAVIRGTAASSDGRTPGITMPSLQAQVDLIKSAYRAAGCDVSETGFFEAHGTGTAAGDPIETGAIGEVFAPHRPLAVNGELIPLAIGSLKTNIGHLEGASGIAGLIKAVSTVKKGIIAPNIWFQKGNPGIDFESWRIQVPTEVMPWPWEGLRRASVNSFGYGGTNAHVIVDDAENYLKRHHHPPNRTRKDSGFVTPTEGGSHASSSRPRIYMLSAHDQRGLRLMGDMVANHVQTRLQINEEHFLDSLAYTLSQRRSRLSYSCPIVAARSPGLEKALRELTPVLHNRSTATRIGFLFTGQGAAWWGMGRELLCYPVFEKSLRSCETCISNLGSQWSLMEELLKEKARSRVSEAAISQPLCTAIQIALVDLLALWNIHPHSVVGHSSGEIAAAYASGALTANAAMTVAFFRGLLAPKVKELGYQGSMMAVGLSEYDANEEIAQLNSRVGEAVVACINSPHGVTISGDKAAVETLHMALVTKGTFAKMLQVDVAYHSRHMQAIAEEYRTRLYEAQIVARKSVRRVPMFSSVTEDEIEPERLGVDYWVANLVGCVRFSGALRKLCMPRADKKGHGVDILLEIGPHALFKLPVRDNLQSTFGEESAIQYLPTLIRNKPADTTALETAGSLYGIGVQVDLQAANFPVELKQVPQVLTNLPQYPWNHSRSYWCESRLSRDYRFRPFARTEILGAPSHDFEPRFRNFLRLREQPWLRDHVVQGDVLFPACGYICMAIEACRQTFSSAAEYQLREVSISRALVVPETEEGVETCFSIRPQSTSGMASSTVWHEFRIFSQTASNEWVENCRGLVSVSLRFDDDQHLTASCQNEWDNAHTKSSQIIDSAFFYKKVGAIGLSYGPLFQGLTDITIDPQRPDRAAGVIEVTNTHSGNPKNYEHQRLLHPATLDNFLQLALASLGGIGLNKLKCAMVPTYVEEISVSANIAAQTGDRLCVVVDAERLGNREAKVNITALDPTTSRLVVLMDGFKFVAINSAKASSDQTQTMTKHCYKPVWEPDVDLIDRLSLDRVLQAAPRPDDRHKTVRELELLAYYFIDQALQTIDESEVCKMLSHHQKLYKNLCELRNAVVGRTHPQQNDEWQQLCSPEVASKLHELTESYRDHRTAYDGKLLVRVGEALPAVFRQEVEPLALMTHENLLEDYYTTAVGMPNTYAQISRCTAMLSHKNPNLEFLEIGAGTGGATVPTLQGLRGREGLQPRVKSYTYTDISSYFFQRAEEKFRDFAHLMNFKKLDIERDPEMQDFEAASYDVIIAANVLHATSNIHCTMTHARKLLRPGGKLILLEMTNRLLAASVIFGTLPGWWNALEEWRTEGPLLTKSQWQDVLLASGFGTLQASSPDVLNPLDEGTRLMIAEAVEPRLSLCNGMLTPPERPNVFIICANLPVRMSRSGEATAFLKKMEQSGVQAEIVHFGVLPKQDFTDSICISFAELEEPILAEPTLQDLSTLQRIAEVSTGLIWVTRGATSTNVERPELAVFQGLARTLRVEHEGFRCITVDLDTPKSSASSAVNLIFNLYRKLFSSRRNSSVADSEFVERDGALQVKRLIEHGPSNTFLVARTDPASLPPRPEELLQDGRQLRLKLSATMAHVTHVWEAHSKPSQVLKSTEVEIQVQAASLATTDVQIINDGLAGRRPGQECSGIITRIGNEVRHLSIGDRVVSWCLDTFSTHVRTQATLVHKIPDSMSFEVITTISVAYVTAYYSLVQTARLIAGETVFIHEAASPVGKAAIHIASSFGASIFVTVHSENEKAYLARKLGIEASRIFSSQNTNFVSALRRITKGYGADVVLNTLSGEMLQATFSCVAPFGRFIDLGKGNADTNARLEMAPFAKNVSFTSVEMNFLYQKNINVAGKIFQDAMNFITENDIQVPPVVDIRPWSKLAEAMELMQGENYTGRVVMVPEAGDVVLVAQQPPPLISLDPAASYLLAGGLGGLGRSISRWLIERGARNLIFVSRSGTTSPSASSFIADLTASGIRTAILRCDISDHVALSAVLADTLKEFPLIKGVLQGAMTLNDSLFSNMTSEKWNDTIRPKVHGSKNLHEVTLNQPLDFFILLSSLHSFIGNPGQSNYAAGCAYQVALAQYRNGLGLPAAAIDLGIVGGVGYVVEKQEDGGKVKVQDLKHISEKEMLALIELGIREPDMGHLVTGLASDVVLDELDENEPFFARDPIYSRLDYLRPHLRTSSASYAAIDSPTSVPTLSLSAQIAASTSLEQTHDAIQVALIKKLSRSLMMDPKEINVNSPMSAYGTDSLVAVELKSWVQRNTKVSVSVFDILQSGSIWDLVSKITERATGRKS